VLGRKHIINDPSVWAAGWERAREVFPDERLDALIDRTAHEMRHRAGGLRVGIAWSGGKDAIVVTWVAERAGLDIVGGVYGTALGLSYHSMLAWVREHRPAYVDILDTGQDLAWLRAHPAMLFPDLAGRTKWSDITHNRAQDIYFARKRLDIILTGRRRLDGNWCGPGGDYVSRGTRRWSPIMDWPHEAVFALLQREGLGLPPCYAGPGGFRNGSMVPWPRRGPWARVWDWEADRVREAAAYGIPGAADFLRTVT
jgi:3'-phosphoadenosine 5'-phosphosulfate sulfotransferase (PAPS reductase)/FAD synthetase